MKMSIVMGDRTIRRMLIRYRSIATNCPCDELSATNCPRRIVLVPFDLLVEALNALQATVVFILTLACQLNFAFTILARDHVASNDIGGWRMLQTLSYKL
jgi:hypothetical protein